jgi:hypothetical protein
MVTMADVLAALRLLSDFNSQAEAFAILQEASAHPEYLMLLLEIIDNVPDCAAAAARQILLISGSSFV